MLNGAGHSGEDDVRVVRVGEGEAAGTGWQALTSALASVRPVVGQAAGLSVHLRFARSALNRYRIPRATGVLVNAKSIAVSFSACVSCRDTLTTWPGQHLVWRQDLVRYAITSRTVFIRKHCKESNNCFPSSKPLGVLSQFHRDLSLGTRETLLNCDSLPQHDTHQQQRHTGRMHERYLRLALNPI